MNIELSAEKYISSKAVELKTLGINIVFEQVEYNDGIKRSGYKVMNKDDFEEHLQRSSVESLDYFEDNFDEISERSISDLIAKMLLSINTEVASSLNKYIKRG